jgi:small conductance mechanosensitive channel
MKIESLMTELSHFVINYGPKLVGAILVWIIGSFIIRKITRALHLIMDKRELDPSLKPFLKSLLGIILKLLLIITVLSMLGVEMTSFIAILGAAGLAVGLALQGSLQNFAGGVIILLFKPYKVGDFIETQGYLGTVKEILIFHTTLKTPDNKIVIIPNGNLSNGSLINYSKEETRRIDFTFGIAYGESVDKARKLILDICNQDDRILNEPAEPFVALSTLADSSVNLAARVWVKGDNYWPVFFETNEKVYKAMNESGISIPFPQMDVHLVGNKK